MKLDLYNEISLTEAMEMNKDRELVAYVMPKVRGPIHKSSSSKKEIVTDESLSFFLTAYINGNYYMIVRGLTKLGHRSYYIAGMRLKIRQTAQSLHIKYMTVEEPTYWIYGGEFTSYEDSILNDTLKTFGVGGRKTKFYHGQTILTYAPPGAGKTYSAEKLSLSYEENGTTMHRVLIGERRDDTLGPNTIKAEAASEVTDQMKVVYKVLTDALRDAYSGKKVCLVIDSLTRIIEQLTDEHTDSHMVSGGISAPVKKMVSDLFRMGGRYDGGYLTIIGTCLYSMQNNTWKNITQELRSAANAEIVADVRSGELNKNRKTESKEVVPLRIFGWEPKLFGKPFDL